MSIIQKKCWGLEHWPNRASNQQNKILLTLVNTFMDSGFPLWLTFSSGNNHWLHWEQSLKMGKQPQQTSLSKTIKWSDGASQNRRQLSRSPGQWSVLSSRGLCLLPLSSSKATVTFVFQCKKVNGNMRMPWMGGTGMFSTSCYLRKITDFTKVYWHFIYTSHNNRRISFHLNLGSFRLI